MLIFVLIVVFLMISWYGWKRFSFCLALPNSTWIDWQLICLAFRRNIPPNMPASSILFQKFINTCKKHESVGMCVIWVFEPILFVFGPEAMKFFANEPSLADRPGVYQFFNYGKQNGIFSSSGQHWKREKKLISPAFYPSVLQILIPIMNDHALSIVQDLRQLENNTTDKIESILKHKALMLFLEATLDMKGDTIENNTKIQSYIKLISEYLDYISYRTTRPWLHFDFIEHFTASGKEQLNRMEEAKLIMKEIVDILAEKYSCQSQITVSGELNPRHKTFGEILMQEHRKNPSFTFEDIGVELFHLLVAGFDSATNTLMWILWLIGLHEDVQEKVYSEIMSETEEIILYKNIRKLQYLECVIKEGMRLYTICVLFGRISQKDIHFGNYTIPSQTHVVLFPYLLHRNPEIYADPESFNPERFAEKESTIKPWNFMPFGESVRPCIGKNYAMLEMKIFLAHIIRNFRIISLTRREDMQLKWDVMLRNVTPVFIKFLPR